jgi:alpha-1,2-mannosyltransferase
LSLSEEEAFAMRQRARKSSWRFSERVFEEAWVRECAGLVGMLPGDRGGKKKK